MEGLENENSVSWRSLLLTLFGAFILCFSIIAIIHAEIVKPKDRGPESIGLFIALGFCILLYLIGVFLDCRQRRNDRRNDIVTSNNSAIALTRAEQPMAITSALAKPPSYGQLSLGPMVRLFSSESDVGTPDTAPPAYSEALDLEE